MVEPLLSCVIYASLHIIGGNRTTRARLASKIKHLVCCTEHFQVCSILYLDPMHRKMPGTRIFFMAIFYLLL